MSNLYFSLGDATLWQGDCRDVLDEIPTGSIDLIFADPPYNIGIDYGTGNRADRLSKKDYHNWSAEWMAWCKRCLSPTGTMWVMINDEWADCFGMLLSAGTLHRRNWIKWYETFGVNCSGKFNRTSRHIFYYTADAKRFTWNLEAVNVQSARQRAGDKRANPAGKNMDDVWQVPRLTGTCAERIPGVPTQVPLEIMRRIVESTANPGDTVLDPFCGSGSSGVAALKHGCKFVGIELNPDYCKLSAARLRPWAKQGVLR